MMEIQVKRERTTKDVVVLIILTLCTWFWAVSGIVHGCICGDYAQGAFDLAFSCLCMLTEIWTEVA